MWDVEPDRHLVGRSLSASTTHRSILLIHPPANDLLSETISQLTITSVFLIIIVGTWRLSCEVLAAVVVQERLYPKILMNFQQKNSRRLLTPPPIPFRKTMLRFFPEIGDRITVYNGKNLQHSFLDRKWPLLWKLGRHRPLIVGT